MTLERLRVAVVRGGNGPDFESSLKTGEAILRTLRESESRYSPVDIFVDRSGIWHVSGLPSDPQRALKYVDLVWSASPQSYDGTRLERLLESMKIPYVGTQAVNAALADSLSHTRVMYAREGLPTVRFAQLSLDDYSDNDLVYIFRNFLHPVTVRIPGKGAMFTSSLVHTYAELENTVAEAFKHSREAIVEEFMKGKRAVLSVIENARGEKRYTLLPTEERDGSHIAPGNFTPEEKRKMTDMARKAHVALGLGSYSASHFLVTPKNVFIIETRALPELYADSPLSKSLSATGWKEKEFVDHLIETAR